MSRKSAFDAYVKKAEAPMQQAIAPVTQHLHTYLEKASLKNLAELAAVGKGTLTLVRDSEAEHSKLRELLPGSPTEIVVRSLAGLSPEELAFLARIPPGQAHHVRAQSKIDESHAAVKSWFDDWKDHATGILNVHKGILDGTHGTGDAIFAALARETVSAYATAFHWLLRPYVKK